ncbi:hypothetical protein O1D97_15365 [Marinomonas sp. 15G1-11]|uniref:Zinc-binding dehydrogenase n=1 Tax=Marinomonas phaeophyticola TaxID=3004091 RepID=A0ABT4JX40_9GAMM|nr:hypothetical protein [Marinomonas sp. 15G1-11]MCZ2722952.1 hypothetical protein [Marinomonas sp. 15G1-11]
MLKEIQVIGSFQFNTEFTQAISVIESNLFDFDLLIAKQYSLNNIDDAFTLATSGKAIGKVQVIIP